MINTLRMSCRINRLDGTRERTHVSTSSRQYAADTFQSGTEQLRSYIRPIFGQGVYDPFNKNNRRLSGRWGASGDSTRT